MINTPIDAIIWLQQKSSRVQIGRDDYADVVQVIRNLVKDRQDVQKLIDGLEKKIYMLENPPKPKHPSKPEPQPFGTEGNGIMTWQIPPDQRK